LPQGRKRKWQSFQIYPFMPTFSMKFYTKRWTSSAERLGYISKTVYESVKN
jgi:hypothetical protein